MLRSGTGCASRRGLLSTGSSSCSSSCSNTALDLPVSSSCSRVYRARSRPSAQTSSGRSTTRNGKGRPTEVCQAAAGHDCVVLGAGIGGLTVAAKLAQSGYNVTVCEQNTELGGRCQTVSFEGCRFDTGPSLLLLPQVYRDSFKWLGSDISDHVELARVEPAAYRVWFADGYGGSQHGSQGCTLDLFNDVQRMVDQLEQVEPGAGG